MAWCWNAKVTATPPKRASMSRMFSAVQPVVSRSARVKQVRPSMWMARWSELSRLQLTSRDLSGELVVGNGPLTTYNWSGQIKGLAVYDRGLLPAEVSQDHANWTAAGTIDGPPDRLNAKHGCPLSFRRRERERGPQPGRHIDHLLIPERFFVLHEEFLELPWMNSVPAGIIGRMSLSTSSLHSAGFLFQAYFSAVGKIKRATRLTIRWDSWSASRSKCCRHFFRPRLRRDRPHYQHIRDGLGATYASGVSSITGLPNPVFHLFIRWINIRL